MENARQRQIKLIRESCLKNAESLLSVAERELNKGVDHVCFHLALLALEELGKAGLVTVAHTISTAGKEENGRTIAVDDHVKKIFWALWGGILTGGRYTKEEIERTKNLATNLHERRLLYLYINPNDPDNLEEKIQKGEAQKLIELTRHRLALERTVELRDEVDDEEIRELQWFFDAIEYPEKRKDIFGSASIKKLQEFEDGKKWIQWLYEVYQKNEEEMRRLAEQELKRRKPSSKEAFEPKYKMRIRIQSQSHSIRNNAFQKWNEGVKDIKLYKSDKKHISKFAKSELLIDLIFPKAVPIHSLWEHAFFIAKTFIISLNIATKGLFWWNVPKDVDRFFEEVQDLEADRNGNIKIGMAINKRLTINWDDAKLVLNQEEMSRVSMVNAYFFWEHKKLEKFLKGYAFAVAIFSKIDIHLRLEANAFDEFFKSFKDALIIFNNWDGKSDLKKSAQAQFGQLPSFKELDKIIQLGIDLQGGKNPKITLTEVAAMKLYCDFYIQKKAIEHFEDLKERKEKSLPPTE